MSLGCEREASTWLDEVKVFVYLERGLPPDKTLLFHVDADEPRWWIILRHWQANGFVVIDRLPFAVRI